MAACGRGQGSGGRSWRDELELERGIVDLSFEVSNAYPPSAKRESAKRMPYQG